VTLAEKHDAKTHTAIGDWASAEELILDIRVALLTTVDRDGHFHTRPVQTLKVDADRALWFFTDWSSTKVDELQHDVRLSLGYAEPSKKEYIALTGLGRLIRDSQKAKELWSIEQRAHYPDGAGRRTTRRPTRAHRARGILDRTGKNLVYRCCRYRRGNGNAGRHHW